MRAVALFTALSFTLLSSCQLVAGLDEPLVARDAGAAGDAGSGLYASAVLSDSPLVYYRLDETSGLVAHDSSGHGTDAAIVGDVALGATGALKNDANAALELTSGTGLVSIPNVFDFAGNVPYAFEMWILPETTSSPATLFGKYEPRAPSIEGTTAFFGGSGAIKIGFERWHQPDLAVFVHEDTVGLVAGVFNHVVFTCDASSPPRMYLNGVRYDGTIKAAGIGPDKLNRPLIFGGEFRGKLDEIAVYDHDLAETRVLAHHRIGKTGS